MSVEQVATALATARRSATRLATFPGDIPADLSTAYAIQDRAVALGGRRVAGWKVAMVPPAMRESLGAERLAGPIFADSLQRAKDGDTLQAPIPAGFAALECEFALRLAVDLLPGAAPFEAEALANSVAAMHAAVEIAGSVVADIATAGPCAMAADHGGNGGAILGPEVPDWRTRPLAELTSRMTIDGTLVGEGSAAKVPDGPLAALAFLANTLAARGIALKAGDIVLSGQTNGVHVVTPGQTARVEFPGIVALHLTVAAGEPR